MQNRLIAITIIRNEEKNYIQSWLDNIANFADYHIFLDDASTDKTKDIIKKHLEKYPGELHERKTSLFSKNEPKLRSLLWEYVRRVAHTGDWILIVDADEFYDEHLLRIKKLLLSNKYQDKDVLRVSCLDMWTPSSYRIDGFWSPMYQDVRLIRFHNVPFGACGSELHMPPYPRTTNINNNIECFVPKIHAAYLRKSDRIRRYNYYKQNVKQETNPIAYKHACSILETKPTLKKHFSFLELLKSCLLKRKINIEIYKELKKHMKSEKKDLL